MLNYAASQLGTPYVYGGNGAFGYDCSGLICEVLKSVGRLGWVDLSAQGLYDKFTAEKEVKSVREASAGDLVFYGKGDITHVAIVYKVIGETVLIIEAGGGDRSTTSAVLAMAKGAQVRIRPIDYRSDLRVLVPVF